MNKLVWLSEKQQLHQLDMGRKKHKEGQSNDGFVVAARGTFKYKGIKYIIKVLRYFQLEKGFMPLGSKRISDMHCVVENDKETREILHLVEKVAQNYNDFLFHDTIFRWDDNLTIQEQIKKCHRLAEIDIDMLFRDIPNIIKNRHPEEREWIKKLNKLAKDNMEDFI